MTLHASVDQLSSYLDAELAKRERAELEGHLQGCSSCRRRLAGLRGVATRLGRLERQAPPSHLAFLVERRVAAESNRGGLLERLEETARTFSLQSWLMPLFGLVVALTLIFYLFSFGVARQEAAGTRVIVPSAGSAPIDVPIETIDGREFRRVADGWLERGRSATEAPEQVLDFTVEPAPPSLAPYAALGGRVRLVHEGRLVELVFEWE